MDTLLRVGLSNAVIAGLLALVAAGVSCVWRRPALVHSLWLLVLFKLVTPPLLTLPILGEPPTVGEPAPASLAGSSPALAAEEAPLATGGAPISSEEDRLFALAMTALVQPETAEATDPTPPTALPPPSEPARDEFSWGLTAGVVWLAGSALWLLLACWRAARFRRLLHHAEPAPAWLQQEVRRLAERLGLAECPGVWLVPGRVSPMLWALLGKPRLLLPMGLWDRLSPEQRSTLLAHELAHLRRRDHWVRGLEVLTTALYWWHPAVWWARRELRHAEEECCDAWVIWTLPRAAKAYATALVETLDFLSEAQATLPLGASGFGHIHDLKRRLTMIMSGSTPRSLTWSGFLAILGLAAVLLPVLPTWAQDGPAKEEDPNRVKIRLVQDDGKSQKVIRLEQPDLDVLNDEQKWKASVEMLRAQVEVAQARLAQAQAQLAQARAKLAEAEKGRGASDDRKQLEIRLKELSGQLKLQSAKPGEAKEEVIIIIKTPDGKVRELKVPEAAILNRRWEVTPSTPSKAGQPGAPPQVKPPAVVRPPVAPDRRMQDLDRKLDQLLREIESIRRELHPSKSEESKAPESQRFRVTTLPIPPAPPAPPVPPKPPAAPLVGEPLENGDLGTYIPVHPKLAPSPARP